MRAHTDIVIHERDRTHKCVIHLIWLVDEKAFIARSDAEHTYQIQLVIIDADDILYMDLWAIIFTWLCVGVRACLDGLVADDELGMGIEHSAQAWTAWNGKQYSAKMYWQTGGMHKQIKRKSLPSFEMRVFFSLGLIFFLRFAFNSKNEMLDKVARTRNDYPIFLLTYSIYWWLIINFATTMTWRIFNFNEYIIAHWKMTIICRIKRSTIIIIWKEREKKTDILSSTINFWQLINEKNKQEKIWKHSIIYLFKTWILSRSERQTTSLNEMMPSPRYNPVPRPTNHVYSYKFPKFPRARPHELI